MAIRETRPETDSMGSVEVPIAAYWGAQTQRSLQHFAIGREAMPAELIHAFGLLKKACALVNAERGQLSPDNAALLCAAADEVASGTLDSQFPLHVWQTGSGTQTNMNVNEVIAGRANECAGGERGGKFPLHPNDHVNLSQSSNDAFSTAMYMAAARAVQQALLPALHRLAGALAAKGTAFQAVVKIGRTHLQDAVPLTVGQEFGGWASLVTRDIARLEQTLPGLYELAIGGTAVGTGLNAPPQFGEQVVAHIAALTGLPFRSHPDKFAALSAHDELVFASGALQTLAGSLLKIANDIRWLASGPRCGLGELVLPANEPGSSMMPGKVNPTQCEALTMVAVQVYGNHAAIAFAGSQGNLQLNVFKPVLIYNFLQSTTLLTDATHAFVTFLVDGIALDEARIAHFVESSLMLATALSPRLGYEKAAQVAQTAQEKKISLRDAAQVLGFLSGSEFDALVCPEAMVGSREKEKT